MPPLRWITARPSVALGALEGRRQNPPRLRSAPRCPHRPCRALGPDCRIPRTTRMGPCQESRALPLVCSPSSKALTGSNRRLMLATPVLQPRPRATCETPAVPLKLLELVGICRTGTVGRGTWSADLGVTDFEAGLPSSQLRSYISNGCVRHRTPSARGFASASSRRPSRDTNVQTGSSPIL